MTRTQDLEKPMNWKNKLRKKYPQPSEPSGFWETGMRGVEDFITTEIIEQIIDEIFANMPTAGESGETIYINVKEVWEFKKELRDKWLGKERE